ncbi:serine/threonine-protein kinase [Granulosicoccaceae sp. 1_MG-2023]|nr:serine/threonine-protein kinase [Granulosicoccaceae sp. 1_MG-2023]
MQIPGYTLKSKLGQGGMASVFLAVQNSLDREVAIKVMDPRMADDPAFCERFLKEGRIAARVSHHPDIVTIFDIGQAAGFYYMAMEYLPGPNLKDLLKDGPYRGDTLAVIRQIAGALGMAHAEGFVHRDVKPANILFKSDGSAALSDFGIAKSVSNETQLTAVGFAVGTPEYMSPEQAMGQSLDHRSDIYSLGVMFYEMLTGEKPYLGQDPFSTALKHINDPLPVLPVEQGDYQPLLDGMLAKDPAARFPDAAALIAAVDQLRETQTRTQELIANPPRRNKSGLFVMLAGLVMLAVGAAAAWWWQPAAAPTAAPAPVVHKNLTEEERARVTRLLMVADAHRGMGRLTEPPGSNALETYEMVLSIDPANNQARQALEEIRQETD